MNRGRHRHSALRMAQDAGLRTGKAPSCRRRQSERAHRGVAPIPTMEQCRPFAEARSELHNADHVFRWFAEESIRSCGRLIPARRDRVQQLVMKELGVVAAFTPWNYPLAQAIRKILAARASACAVIQRSSRKCRLPSW